MKEYNVVIIGAGSIGALKDDDKDFPGGENTLTHAHAFHKHSRFRILEIRDIDKVKENLACKKWGVQDIYYSNLDVDVVSVCVPTQDHHEVLEGIPLVFPHVKLVIVEKPFCSTLREAQEIEALYKDKDVPLLVNYTRRFDEYLVDLRDMIRGTTSLYCEILYSRGLLRDGCHGLDFLHWFFGELELIYRGLEIGDGESEDDPSTNLIFRSERCPICQMIPIDSRVVGCFDTNIYTDIGKILIRNYGVYGEMYSISLSNEYGSYPVYSNKGMTVKTGLLNSLDEMVSHALSVIEGKEEIRCTVKDAIYVHKINQKIRGN